MEGKLIKTSKDSHHNGHYFLNDSDGFAIGSTDKDWCKRAVTKKPLYILSLSNCQAIERGYDLNELVKERFGEAFWHDGDKYFKEGFQKALEVNADKRFTLKEMVDCWNRALEFQTHKETLGEYIKSLKQTEWDVEVEMICPHPSDTYRCGIQYGCDEDGCNHPNQIPYLDADGCLILKLKSK